MNLDRGRGKHEALLQILYTLHSAGRNGSGMRGIKHND